MTSRPWPRFFPTVLLLATLFSVSCSSQNDNETESRLTQAATMTVTTVALEMKTVEARLIVTGTVEPWQTLTLSSEISGLRILEAPFEVGNFVERGKPLVFLNARELNAQLSAAQARYDSSLANLTKAQNPNRSQQVSALKAVVDQAKAAVAQEEANLAQTKINQANAARSAQRFEQALEEGYVTALEADNRVSDREAQSAAIAAAEQRIRASKANLAKTEQDLQLSQAQGRPEDISIAQAQVRENAAAIDQLRAQIEKTIIRAPDSGFILTKQAFLGGVVTVGQELFTMARQGRVQLWGSIPQDDLSKIEIGRKVVFGYESSKLPAVIEEIDPKIDPQTRQGRVRISLESSDKDKPIKVGSFIEGEILLPSQEVSVVPYESIQGETDRFTVFVLDEGKVRSVEVDLGSRYDDLVEVRRGLSKEDQVVVSGAAFLNSGDFVKVVTQ